MLSDVLKQQHASSSARFVRFVDLWMQRFEHLAADAVLSARLLVPGPSGPVATSSQNPVVLVHGYGADVGSLHFLERLLRSDGFQVFGADLDTIHCTVDALSEQLARRIERVLARTGAEKVDLVGHSLGGILARYYIQALDGWRQVERLVTIGTPHWGTYASHGVQALRFARLYPFPPAGTCAQELLPGSDLYRRLNSSALEVCRCDRVRFTNIWSYADELIWPQTNARFPRATREKVYWTKGHVMLVISPAVYSFVRSVLLEK